jgi:hypothetical protein
MQWQEFVELQQCLIQWHQVFTQYDHDRSGFIEANENRLVSYKQSVSDLNCLAIVEKNNNKSLKIPKG